jgi:ketosteroid isomerase-like protein
MTNGGRENEITGRRSHVFVDRNGDWKIVHEHFSRAQHPPELWDTSPGE